MQTWECVVYHKLGQFSLLRLFVFVSCDAMALNWSPRGKRTLEAGMYLSLSTFTFLLRNVRTDAFLAQCWWMLIASAFSCAARKRAILVLPAIACFPSSLAARSPTPISRDWQERCPFPLFCCLYCCLTGIFGHFGSCLDVH